MSTRGVSDAHRKEAGGGDLRGPASRQWVVRDCEGTSGSAATETPGTTASRLPRRGDGTGTRPGTLQVHARPAINRIECSDDRRTSPTPGDGSPPPGRSGGRTSASGSGAPSARTTARTATPGTTSPTTRPARAPIAGARTASPASPTTSSGSASRWPCGTARTRSSRSGCSA